MDIPAFVRQQNLPTNYASIAQKWFIPAANRALLHKKSADSPLCIAINGCQGSGKSTLAAFFQAYFTEQHTLQCATISIDDFYLTRMARQQLASEVHPLFATRGVPGTHDTSIAIDTIDALKKGLTPALPRFNKATDNPFERKSWPRVSSACDVILFEGWCVGLPPQEEADLIVPVNALEQEEDKDAIWRNYVNQQLKGEYQSLFSRIDHLIMLKAPSFEQVYRWRLEQEHHLIKRLNDEHLDASHTMSDSQIARFVMHYQRLTEYGLRVLPERADQVLSLDDNRQVVACEVKHD